MFGCTKEKAAEKVEQVTDRVEKRLHPEQDVEVPLGQRASREQMERERFDADWLRLKSFQTAARRRAAADQAALPGTNGQRLTFVPAVPGAPSEKLETVNYGAIDALPVTVPIRGDVAGSSVLRTQILLDRALFSPGMIDGRWGKNSAIAVYWFQRENGLDTTGDVDEETYRKLHAASGSAPAFVRYTLTADDVKGPFVRIPEDVYDKEKLDCLCYESLTEKLEEKFHVDRAILQFANPSVDLDRLQAGQQILTPNVRPPAPETTTPDVTRIVVSARGSYLHGLAADGRVIFHAPTTLGSKYDPSPNETTKLVAKAWNPHFHYQPTLFHEVPDDEPEAHLQPGPNSPVGVIWMALSKPHFGIHGTAEPDTIGYASSHGCVRLTNWDAQTLGRRVAKGVQVEFVDTRREEES